jgi:hypothetical protein
MGFAPWSASMRVGWCCSSRGTEMLPTFPEIEVGAAQLPDASALDGDPPDEGVVGPD